MNIEKSVLTGLGVSSADADKYLGKLNSILPAHGIETFLRIAHFLAQIIHESGRMRLVEENLNYTAERLHEVFPSRFRSVAAAQPYHRNPEKIGNKIYGGRMGNGPESSGDGYRYRGRGLIQLTGRDNYEAFAAWLGDADIITNPDLVKTLYPVESAVYYWSEHGLNALADVDNVKGITLKINGGYNGLHERIVLLNKAKALLNASPQAPDAPAPSPAATLDQATHRVTATGLNLRTTPEVPRPKYKNRIGVLGQGKEVIKLKDADDPDWVQIRTLYMGILREGFVAAKHLEPLPTAAVSTVVITESPPVSPAPPAAFAIPTSHMQENRRDITRVRDGGRAYPLGEPGRPKRNGRTPDKKAEQLIEIVNYLDSEKPSHQRYKASRGSTFCNIYAYDYCYLAGVFLPRTWWTGPALRRIRDGEDVPVVYGDTVSELNANALHDWLKDYGAGFGWINEVDLDSLQASANQGEVCIIVAKRKDLARSGHIVAVVPEHDAFSAKRNSAGEVSQPVESQAGASNFRVKVGSRQWWQDDKFQSFGYWRVK